LPDVFSCCEDGKKLDEIGMSLGDSTKNPDMHSLISKIDNEFKKLDLAGCFPDFTGDSADLYCKGTKNVLGTFFQREDYKKYFNNYILNHESEIKKNIDIGKESNPEKLRKFIEDNIAYDNHNSYPIRDFYTKLAKLKIQILVLENDLSNSTLKDRKDWRNSQETRLIKIKQLYSNLYENPFEFTLGSSPKSSVSKDDSLGRISQMKSIGNGMSGMSQRSTNWGISQIQSALLTQSTILKEFNDKSKTLLSNFLQEFESGNFKITPQEDLLESLPINSNSLDLFNVQKSAGSLLLNLETPSKWDILLSKLHEKDSCQLRGSVQMIMREKKLSFDMGAKSFKNLLEASDTNARNTAFQKLDLLPDITRAKKSVIERQGFDTANQMDGKCVGTAIAQALEGFNDVTDISDDLLYRVFYFAQEGYSSDGKIYFDKKLIPENVNNQTHIENRRGVYMDNKDPVRPALDFLSRYSLPDDKASLSPTHQKHIRIKDFQTWPETKTLSVPDRQKLLDGILKKGGDPILTVRNASTITQNDWIVSFKRDGRISHGITIIDQGIGMSPEGKQEEYYLIAHSFGSISSFQKIPKKVLLEQIASVAVISSIVKTPNN